MDCFLNSINGGENMVDLEALGLTEIGQLLFFLVCVQVVSNIAIIYYLNKRK